MRRLRRRQGAARLAAGMLGLVLGMSSCGRDDPNRPDATALIEPVRSDPDTTIEIVNGTNAPTVAPLLLGATGVASVFKSVNLLTGDAYRLVGGAAEVPVAAKELLSQAYSGPALIAQLASIDELAASGSMATSPVDPNVTVQGVQEETASCVIAAVRIDDRGLYAFPDSVEIVGAVVQLRLTSGVWKVESLVAIGTDGIDELTCVGAATPPPPDPPDSSVPASVTSPPDPPTSLSQTVPVTEPGGLIVAPG